MGRAGVRGQFQVFGGGSQQELSTFQFIDAARVKDVQLCLQASLALFGGAFQQVQIAGRQYTSDPCGLDPPQLGAHGVQLLADVRNVPFKVGQLRFQRVDLDLQGGLEVFRLG